MPANQPLTKKEKEKIFGRFDFSIQDGGSVKILGRWPRENIIKVFLPELMGIKGAPKDLKIYFHRLAAPQLCLFFKALKEADLLKYILSWDGSFVPRLVRGGTDLSSHAYGIAFDINARWNVMGSVPAENKKTGTVRPLVPVAKKHGFCWGGEFKRPDGMHFEVNKII
jgi:hypothetical protein